MNVPEDMNVPLPQRERALCERYLTLLGISRRPPDSAALAEIVHAQALRIPFENLSKVYYRKHNGLQSLIGFEEYLDGIERYHFGGTCYATNYYLNRLLTYLGFDVKLCGADMRHPDVHIVNIVALEGREYLVDAGYAAPFLRPIPRDLSTDVEIVLGSSRYVLRPRDSAGRSQLLLYREGELKHGYTVKPEPRQIAEFEGVIASSFRDKSTFMNALLLVHLEDDRAMVIHNMSLIESQGAAFTKRPLGSQAELAGLITSLFGMPRSIVDDTLAGLPLTADAWG